MSLTSNLEETLTKFVFVWLILNMDLTDGIEQLGWEKRITPTTETEA